MVLKSRKFYIWLIGLGTVFVIYFLYSFISRTSPIDVNEEFSRGPSQEKTPGFGSERGAIGDVKVGTVSVARYRTKDREFGFEKLLHKSGDRWEIEKPYMKVFRPGLRCDITAATGTVDVEMAASRPSPKDARLGGGVTIHILPEETTEMREGFIYLDDLVFVSERSEFSTDGPVRFVSQQAELVGRGLRLVYDEAVDQLVLLKIVDLDFLHLKEQPGKAFLAGDGGKSTSVSTVSDTPKPRGEIKPSGIPAAPVSKSGQYYKCMLSKNVVIEYGRQLIFADKVFIDNLFQDSSKKQHGDKPVGSVRSVKAGSTAEGVSVPARPIEAQQPSDDYVDVHVTCEGGIVVTPMEPAGNPMDSLRSAANQELSPHKSKVLFAKSDSGSAYAETIQDYGRVPVHPSNDKDVDAGNVLRAERINYDMLTGNVVAVGPVDFTLITGSLDDKQPGNDVLPVRITADRKAQFLAASNKVVFEGNVVGKMLEKKQDYEQATRVFGEKLIATLSSRQSDGTGEDSSGRIEHARVAGGVVKLEIIRTSPKGFWSGSELKCAQLDYDKSSEMVTATGPGLIKVDNSNAPMQETGSSPLGLKKPCYALIDNFEKLQWFIQAERIVAEAKSQGVHIGYLPIEDTGFGRPVSINTSNVDVRLSGTSSGRSEISTLSASGGIYYSEGRLYEFVGSKLFYDGKSSIVHVEGEPGRACLLNGVFVEDITYDLTTGGVQADIAGAGALMMKGGK